MLRLEDELHATRKALQVERQMRNQLEEQLHATQHTAPQQQQHTAAALTATSSTSYPASTASSAIEWPHLSRQLSSDGGGLMFETPAATVAKQGTGRSNESLAQGRAVADYPLLTGAGALSAADAVLRGSGSTPLMGSSRAAAATSTADGRRSDTGNVAAIKGLSSVLKHTAEAGAGQTSQSSGLQATLTKFSKFPAKIGSPQTNSRASSQTRSKASPTRSQSVPHKQSDWCSNWQALAREEQHAHDLHCKHRYSARTSASKDPPQHHGAADSPTGRRTKHQQHASAGNHQQPSPSRSRASPAKPPYGGGRGGGKRHGGSASISCASPASTRGNSPAKWGGSFSKTMPGSIGKPAGAHLHSSMNGFSILQALGTTHSNISTAGMYPNSLTQPALSNAPAQQQPNTNSSSGSGWGRSWLLQQQSPDTVDNTALSMSGAGLQDATVSHQHAAVSASPAHKPPAEVSSFIHSRKAVADNHKQPSQAALHSAPSTAANDRYAKPAEHHKPKYHKNQSQQQWQQQQQPQKQQQRPSSGQSMVEKVTEKAQSCSYVTQPSQLSNHSLHSPTVQHQGSTHDIPMVRYSDGDDQYKEDFDDTADNDDLLSTASTDAAHAVADKTMDLTTQTATHVQLTNERSLGAVATPPSYEVASASKAQDLSQDTVIPEYESDPPAVTAEGAAAAEDGCDDDDHAYDDEEFEAAPDRTPEPGASHTHNSWQHQPMQQQSAYQPQQQQQQQQQSTANQQGTASSRAQLSCGMSGNYVYCVSIPDQPNNSTSPKASQQHATAGNHKLDIEQPCHSTGQADSGSCSESSGSNSVLMSSPVISRQSSPYVNSSASMPLHAVHTKSPSEAQVSRQSSSGVARNSIQQTGSFRRQSSGTTKQPPGALAVEQLDSSLHMLGNLNGAALRKSFSRPATVLSPVLSKSASKQTRVSNSSGDNDRSIVTQVGSSNSRNVRPDGTYAAYYADNTMHRPGLAESSSAGGNASPPLSPAGSVVKRTSSSGGRTSGRLPSAAANTGSLMFLLGAGASSLQARHLSKQLSHAPMRSEHSDLPKQMQPQ